jgi:hypothetical protein
MKVPAAFLVFISGLLIFVFLSTAVVIKIERNKKKLTTFASLPEVIIHEEPTQPLLVSDEAPLSLTRQQFIERFYHATVLMYYPTEDGGEKMACTATAFKKVNKGYYFVSASHCVEGKTSVDLSRDEETSGKKIYYHAVVVASSDQTAGVDASVLLVETSDKFEIIPVGHNPSHIGENIMNLSAPGGAPKQLFLGQVTSLYLNRPIVLPEGARWEGYLLVMVPGDGPGSSGSMMVCEAQWAACGLMVGHGPGVMVVLPIDRFNAWWSEVQKGKVPSHPPSKVEEPLEERLLKGIGKIII